MRKINLEILKKELERIEEILFNIDLIDHWTHKEYEEYQNYENQRLQLKQLIAQN